MKPRRPWNYCFGKYETKAFVKLSDPPLFFLCWSLVMRWKVPLSLSFPPRSLSGPCHWPKYRERGPNLPCWEFNVQCWNEEENNLADKIWLFRRLSISLRLSDLQKEQTEFVLISSLLFQPKYLSGNNLNCGKTTRSYLDHTVPSGFGSNLDQISSNHKVNFFFTNILKLSTWDF